ncbi:MAG: hypothetical protein LH473_10615 [Chitinophagales bacterium]|nr:hypothetical protein [Chitinophagales bacterium]
MTDTKIKEQLHKKIEGLDATQLTEVYGLIENYFQDNVLSEEWDNLSVEIKLQIDSGINELDKGKGIPHEMVMKEIKSKYGIREN